MVRFSFLPSGDVQGVREAWAAGADVRSLNAEDDSPALHTAASHGHLDAVEELLSRCGAPASQQRPSDGKTALHVAAEEGHVQVRPIAS